MYKIGITGGIGSGKSLITNVFTVLGVPVYNADTQAKILQDTHPDIINPTKQLLGTESYLPNGMLNRAWVAQKVFGNALLLSQLNAIIHPVVYAHFIDWCTKQNALNVSYILYESALTVETGYYKKLDKLIVVTAPEVLRVHRVLRRDPHRTVEQIKNILQAQMPDSEKVLVADFVINNDDKSLILPGILGIHHQILHLLPHEFVIRE